MGEDLVLDTAIRDWVLIPLSVVMVLIGILRYFVSKLMRSSSQLSDPKIIKEGHVVIRARNLRAGANFIPVKSFHARKFYYSIESLGAEWDGLDIIQHEWALPKFEQRAGAVLRKLVY